MKTSRKLLSFMITILLFISLVSPVSAIRIPVWHDATKVIRIYANDQTAHLYAYFSINGISWTSMPGLEMKPVSVGSGMRYLDIRIGQSTGIYLALNDGNGHWDGGKDPSTKNRLYFIPASFKSVTIGNGKMVQGKVNSIRVALSQTINTTQANMVSSLSINSVQPSVTIESKPPAATGMSVSQPTASPNMATPSLPVEHFANSEQDPFSWGNASVYFVLVDRFVNGDPTNDHAYGREMINGAVREGYQERTGTFHGGDFTGLTEKVNEGYFNKLGVNAIWISAPYEQIHGWVGGENFTYYGYHGYWPLDYTEMDQNFGTREQFKAFVDAAHTHHIRVVMDIVMNHAGYDNLQDMNEFGYGTLQNGWQDYVKGNPDQASYRTYPNYLNRDATEPWSRYWGSDWTRMKDTAGYDNCASGDDLSICLAGLPDFKVESGQTVSLPPILLKKWSADKKAIEQKKLDDFFAKSGRKRTVSNYLIAWLTDWVRTYGIDGFRCDTAKHVPQQVWKDLKTESVKALAEWKQANPDLKLDDLPFWMTGEVWDHGVSKDSYFDNGFDSLINFQFQNVPNRMNGLDTVYTNYSNQINTSRTFNALSYISSHDKGLYNRNDLINGGSALLLSPGAIQIFYGDESARPEVNAPYDERARSNMNWNHMNQTILEHWQKIGTFREHHPAIGGGIHHKISDAPYTFSREWHDQKIDDAVVVALNVSEQAVIQTGSIFAEGSKVHEAYSDQTAVVTDGHLTLSGIKNGVVLLEQLK